jgi:hypothetical protein
MRKPWLLTDTYFIFQFPIGKLSIDGSFSIAMLNKQRQLDKQLEWGEVTNMMT